MLIKFSLAVALVAATAVVGCGGSGDNATHNFNKLSACVKKEPGLDVSTSRSRLDIIAQKAEEGGIDIDFGGNHVTLDVEANQKAAKGVGKLYEMFAKISPGLEIEQHGNVVVAWDKSPDEHEASLITGCIKAS